MDLSVVAQLESNPTSEPLAACHKEVSLPTHKVLDSGLSAK
jgi:hypothetical protein